MGVGAPLALALWLLGQTAPPLAVPVELVAVALRLPKGAPGAAKPKSPRQKPTGLETTPLDREILPLLPGEPGRLVLPNGTELFLTLRSVDRKARTVRLHERVVIGSYAYESDATVKSGGKGHLNGGMTSDGALVLVSLSPKLP